jgi:hypothetical protein
MLLNAYALFHAGFTEGDGFFNHVGRNGQIGIDFLQSKAQGLSFHECRWLIPRRSSSA